MGYEASVSASSSASSGNKTSIGPVTFGGIAFAPETAASTGLSGREILLVLALAGAAWFAWKKGAL